MEIGMIEGCTRVIGESQGYLGLPILDTQVNCTVNGEGTPAMITAWMPTDEEIEAIQAGAPIFLQLLGTQHPPVMMFVGGVNYNETEGA